MIPGRHQCFHYFIDLSSLIQHFSDPGPFFCWLITNYESLPVVYPPFSCPPQSPPLPLPLDLPISIPIPTLPIQSKSIPPHAPPISIRIRIPLPLRLIPKPNLLIPIPPPRRQPPPQPPHTFTIPINLLILLCPGRRERPIDRRSRHEIRVRPRLHRWPRVAILLKR